MKTKKYLILIPLLFLSILSNGQAPGYLGKRAILSLNFSSSIAFESPSQNNRGGEFFGEGSGDIGLNYEFDGTFSYVIGRYQSLGLGFSQYYTGVSSEASTNALPDNASNFGVDRHDLFHRLNVKAISLTYHRFKINRGALAPLGHNFYVGLRYSNVSAKVIDKRTFFANTDQGLLFGHGKLGINQKHNIYSILIGWSYDRLFWDKVFFKTGVRLALPIMPELRYWTGEAVDYPDYDQNPNQAIFEFNVFDRVLAHELIRFNVGIGYLLF